MSEQKWKPGDVAMRVSSNGATKYVATRVARCVSTGSSLKSQPHWHFVSKATDVPQCASDNLATYRPLVVIDPEDGEQVYRLADAFCNERWSHRSNSDECDPLTRSSMQAALREFASPTPPKPDEPLGLGAVVEDAEGGRWIKIDEHSECNDWVDLGAHNHKPDDEFETARHFYRNITAVRVLSEGVQ